MFDGSGRYIEFRKKISEDRRSGKTRQIVYTERPVTR
jgi:hypothetical protein